MRRAGVGLFALVLLCIGSASAAIDQIQLLDKAGKMPNDLFIFMAVVMVATLIVAYRYNDEMAGILSIGSAFLVMWTSRGIDYTVGVTDTTPVVVHTIYQNDVMTVFAVLCLFMAIANMYRIYVLSKKEGTTTIASQNAGQGQ